MLGIVLIIVGIAVWALLSPILGIILVVCGVLLMLAPWPGAYGYGWYRGRRGPP